MTIFLLILAIVLVGGTAVIASGRPVPGSSRWRSRSDRAGDDGAGSAPPVPAGMMPPVASLPPVLLPESPVARDVDALRFGLGLRGYRMDQVDEALDRLAAALDERDAEIRTLREQLASHPNPTQP